MFLLTLPRLSLFACSVGVELGPSLADSCSRSQLLVLASKRGEEVKMEL